MIGSSAPVPQLEAPQHPDLVPLEARSAASPYFSLIVTFRSELLIARSLNQDSLIYLTKTQPQPVRTRRDSAGVSAATSSAASVITA